MGFGCPLLLAGAAVGLLPSSDLAVSLQKLAAMVAATIVLLGIPRLGAAWRARLCWAMLLLGVAASLAGNVLVDRNSWKLDALNRPVYALFAQVPRLSDVAFSQNGLAALLVLTIPLGAALACAGRGRATASVLTAGLILELLVTESRAGILSLGLACAVLVFVGRGRRRWLALLPAGAALAIVATGSLTLPMTATWLPTGGSSAERLAIWQSSLLMIADLPLTGIGLGMFQRVYPLYILPAYENIHPHAHNLFLQTYLDAGPLGCAGMLLLATAASLAIARLGRRQRAEPAAYGAAVSSAAALLHAQVDCYFAGDPRTYVLLFVPLGLLLAYAPPARPAITRRSLAAGSLLAAGAVLAALPWLAPLAFVNAGSAARLKTQPAAARAAFEEALRLQPHSWVAERGLGLVEPSRTELRAAIADGAPGPLVHLELARMLDAAGDEPGAIEQWRLAGAAPLLTRGDGTRTIELATEVDPAYAAAHVRLAEAYLKDGRWAAAERELERCLRLRADTRGDRAYAHLLLGLTAYWADDDAARGVEQIRAAIRADPDVDALYRGLADLLESLGQPAQAAALRSEAEVVARTTHRRSDTLGHAYAALGANLSLIPLAQREYRIVAASDPIGHYDLGQLSLDGGNLPEALAQLQAAVRAIPNQEQFRLGLARAYLSAGEIAPAQQQYATVLELDPGNAEARAATSPAGYRA